MNWAAIGKGFAVVVGAVAAVFAVVGGIWAFGQFLGEKRQDPIRIDSGELGPSPDPCGDVSGILRGSFDPSKDIDFYEDNGLLIYQNPDLQMDVVSQKEDETIKIAPFLVIKTTDISTVPETADLIVKMPSGGCGPGYPDQFVATLAPNRDKVFGAPQSEYWQWYKETHGRSDKSLKRRVKVGHEPEYLVKAQKVPADYFTLTPGEREVFQISFPTSPGFLYRFRVGVQYSYGGEEGINFTDREFVATGEPLEADVWATGGEGHSEDIWRKWAYLSHGELGPPRAQGAEDRPAVTPGDTVTPKYITHQIKQEEEELKKYQSSFELPQSQQEE